MPLRRLDHVNIRTARLDEMIAWYEDILGMTTGPRPDFPFPGAWLYVEGVAAVHLIGVDGDPGAGSEQALKLEHFAFSATDRAAFEAKLAARAVPCRQADVRDAGVVQYNIHDPDGNHIHIDFPLDE